MQDILEKSIVKYLLGVLMEDLQKVACKVYAVLLDNKEARDCDRLLLTKIWVRETKAESVADFLLELVQGKLTHFESIRRVRQKLQEQHVDLRGDKYETRHGMQGEVCEQLSFFDLW